MTPHEKKYTLEPSFKQRAESLQAEFFYINFKKYFNILNDPSNYIHYNTEIKAELKNELKIMSDKRKPKKDRKKNRPKLQWFKHYKD